MIFRRSARLPTRALAAYLEGDLTAAQLKRVEAQVASSEETRARLDDLRRLRVRLSAPLAEEDDFDVTAAVRRALDTPPVAPPTLPRRGRGVGYLAAFAASAALAIAAYGRHDAPESEFRPKAAEAGGEAQRWSGIQVFRVRGSEPPLPLEDSLSPSDGLLFSYRNEGRDPYRYLMIFALDAAAEVRWFHPAYERAGTDPESIPIAVTSGQTLLPAVIHHDPAEGSLSFYALFTNRPLRTSEVEAWLATHPAGSSSLLAPGARLQVLPARVVP